MSQQHTDYVGKNFYMEKLKLFIILLLSVLLIVSISQYQNIVEENLILKLKLKLKLSEQPSVLQNTPKPIISINDNCSEKSLNNPNKNTEVANVVNENDSFVANSADITKTVTTQENRNAETVPFEDQEIDYEWATKVETAV